ncbi:MAG: C40 family peptidase [Candidatus Eremiobacteraeota bacterium]|nr:C40 family peptidase [Candidatus Eremiobacteraeota bacterium]MCW5869209.1 C40 family peptidase [Candidatus Eremiobacteraeota bacterium]
MRKLFPLFLCLQLCAQAADLPGCSHRLQRGQTVAAVARLYGLPVAEVLAANPGLDVYHLEIGTPILLPTPVNGWPQRQLTAGETARTLGVPLEQLSNLNPGVDLECLGAGQTLNIPVATPGPPPPVEAPPSGDWQQVTLPDGRKGWAPRATMLIPSPTPLAPGQVVELAQRFQGAPYVWGGMSPNGVDCSGFVQEVFRLSGHSLPRLADEQFQQTSPIDQPQPGDLVFFTTYLPGPSHVGISLGGQDFLHASSSRGVIRASLEDNYFKSRYLGAHRLSVWTQNQQARNP